MDVPGTLDDVVVVPPTPVVDVVLPAPVVVVEDAVVEVDEVDVVVGVVGVGSVVGDGAKIFLTVVPSPEWPKISARGRPAMSSTTVTKIRETTKTPAIASATTGQRRCDRGSVAPVGTSTGVVS
jgi:hypothetical protein